MEAGRPERGGSAAPAIGLWARSEVRRRWRSLVVLGVIAGVAGGVCMAAIAGARRTTTAYARFSRATAAPDAILFGTQVGLFDADYSRVVKLPEVTAWGVFNLAPVWLKGYDELGTLAPGPQGGLYVTLSRPLIRRGRLPDPRRADEVVVNETAARKFHLRVGDHVTVASSTDLNAFFGQGPMPPGPSTRATIVGVGESTMDLIFTLNQPSFFPSPGFLARYGDQIPHAPNLVVRLRPGTDVEAFHRRATAAMGRPDVPLRSLAGDAKRVTHATDVEHTALLLFAAAAALAGLVLVGQALNRSVYGLAESAPSLRALGLTNRNLVAGMAAAHALTAAVAAAVSAVTAVALSSRFPVGLARRLDPDLGVHVDPRVVVPGAVVVLALVVLGSLTSAERAAFALGRRSARVRTPTVMGAVRNVAPLPVAIGAALALERGRREPSVPVRPALAGAVAAILGVVGALGLVRGIDDAMAHPQRSGQIWQGEVWPDDSHTLASELAAVRRDREVDTIVQSSRVPLDVDGAGLPVYALTPQRGSFSYVVLTGRAPASPDEAVIGPQSAKALHLAIGRHVHVAGRSFRVTGTALLPQTPHSSFDQGVWVTPAGLARASAGSKPNTDETLLVTARRGVTSAAFAGALAKRLGVEVDATTQPQDVLFLRNVRGLPVALAGFLVLLGLAAVGHVLATTVRRRRHDLAVLRVLGFRAGQNAACVAWQATTVAVVGVVLGVPLGIAAGHASWQWVADATPLQYVAPLAALAVLAALPGSVAVANLLALVPARRAARLRPAEVLRSE